MLNCISNFTEIFNNKNIFIGIMVGHVTPEAFDGGPIALLEEGDSITIDASTRQINIVSNI